MGEANLIFTGITKLCANLLLINTVNYNESNNNLDSHFIIETKKVKQSDMKMEWQTKTCLQGPEFSGDPSNQQFTMMKEIMAVMIIMVI